MAGRNSTRPQVGRSRSSDNDDMAIHDVLLWRKPVSQLTSVVSNAVGEFPLPVANPLNIAIAGYNWQLGAKM